MPSTMATYDDVVQRLRELAEPAHLAGFALMASLAIHDKKADDAKFEAFFRAIVAGSTDTRNFVRKAVNWALRQIGKRNAALRLQAIAVAEEILASGDKRSRWVANDALRELRGRA